jgi:hypothetical protein
LCSADSLAANFAAAQPTRRAANLFTGLRPVLQAESLPILKISSAGLRTTCDDSANENSRIFGSEQILPGDVLARELQAFARADRSSDHAAPHLVARASCCHVAVLTRWQGMAVALTKDQAGCWTAFRLRPHRRSTARVVRGMFQPIFAAVSRPNPVDS